VDATIRFPDEVDDDVVRSLTAWLREDPAVARDVTVRLGSARAGAGEQGGASDAIQLIFTDAVSLANVMIAYSAWRSTRTARLRAVFERGKRRAEDADGSAESLDHVAESLTRDE
jgi:hypothetical protein